MSRIFGVLSKKKRRGLQFGDLGFSLRFVFINVVLNFKVKSLTYFTYDDGISKHNFKI